MKPLGMEVWRDHPSPATRATECRPVGGCASGVPLYIYIYPNDIFEVEKIFFKNYFQKNQLSIPDSRPKQHQPNLKTSLAKI